MGTSMMMQIRTQRQRWTIQSKTMATVTMSQTKGLTSTSSRRRSWTFPSHVTATSTIDNSMSSMYSLTEQSLSAGGQQQETVPSTFLLERAMRHGDRPFIKNHDYSNQNKAINGTGTNMSYNDVLQRTQSLKRELVRRRQHQGTTTTTTTTSSQRPHFVVHSSQPGSDYVATQWSCFATANHVSVPVATSHQTSELRHILEDTDPDVIVVSTGTRASAAPNRFQLLDAAASLKMTDRVIELDTDYTIIGHHQQQQTNEDDGNELDVDFLLHSHNITGPYSSHHRINYATAESTGTSSPALLIYTSGTTGRPKGVLHTHQNLYYQITDLVNAWEWQSNDIALHMLPLHHVHGIVNILGCAAYCGAQIHFTPFDAISLWKHWASPSVDSHTVGGTVPTVLMAVPTIYAKLLEVVKTGQIDPITVQSAIERTLRPMRLQVSGSAALPISVMEEWETLTGHTLLERYGMTEFAMALSNPYRQHHHPSSHKEGADSSNSNSSSSRTILYPPHLPPYTNNVTQKRIPGHVGLPLPSVQVRLVDDTKPNSILLQANGNNDIVFVQTTTTAATNKETAEDKMQPQQDEGKEEQRPKVEDGRSTTTNSTIVGALQVRGPTVFHGYWNRVDATVEAFTQDGWFDTGDVAEYNHLYDSFKILGRSSVDILKVGGYKISALEIERHVLDHPRLVEVVCVGVEDTIWGQRIAIIGRQNHSSSTSGGGDTPITLTELQDWCKPRLAKYKIPTMLLLVDDIPKNAMGKVNKKDLVRLFTESG
jgi:malonyl-CoA/methylmalonyl-CoA synthetase